MVEIEGTDVLDHSDRSAIFKRIDIGGAFVRTVPAFNARRLAGGLNWLVVKVPGPAIHREVPFGISRAGGDPIVAIVGSRHRPHRKAVQIVVVMVGDYGFV